eukprot:scaffold67467_cov63-Phaeocystis_antarctica.AAC.4
MCCTPSLGYALGHTLGFRLHRSPLEPRQVLLPKVVLTRLPTLLAVVHDAEVAWKRIEQRNLPSLLLDVQLTTPM